MEARRILLMRHAKKPDNSGEAPPAPRRPGAFNGGAPSAATGRAAQGSHVRQRKLLMSSRGQAGRGG